MLTTSEWVFNSRASEKSRALFYGFHLLFCGCACVFARFNGSGSVRDGCVTESSMQQRKQTAAQRRADGEARARALRIAYADASPVQKNTERKEYLVFTR